ncbi:hypothetical protein [Chroogloeocystis siderophila]|jgi:hypothetical protein|uniref:Uncharacterized protein n=1 Tax=Chroogloeocystis siderophila 5.2 s.c.1 TaxID=247279 RepID=A0A1U7HXV9_9CHRO|nr:hypothetical protein [Chroogloeocystis siderophila]OKH28406.1 hypothetical protein NIES1031_03975 [Chroogloeocystis siderophila 5.2 s.c.1]
MKRSATLAVLLLSVVTVLASAYLPVTVYSQANLSEVKLGLPLPFIIQNQNYHPQFPWQTGLRSVWENPTQILWLVFFLDVFIVFGAFSLVLKVFQNFFYTTP